MGEFRTLVLAKVLAVRDSCCVYPSCAHCYCKLHLQADRDRYECLRCHALYTGTDLKYRYCLNLTIADDETLCDVAVFGTCLEPFLGTTANGLKSFLDDHLQRSKTLTGNDPESLLHKALENSLVGLMFLFGFKVKCERSKSQRQRHSPVRIRNILEKTCQQKNGYHGKIPQLVAHQMVHANRETPFVSVLDLLKQILKADTEDNALEANRDLYVSEKILPSRNSVNSSDISWCSSSYSGASLSRVSLGQQSLVLSCDESKTGSAMSSSMSCDLQNETYEKIDTSINDRSQDETYFEENLDDQSNKQQVIDCIQNEMRNVADVDGRREDLAPGRDESNIDCREDVDVPKERQKCRLSFPQQHSNTKCDNMSSQFLEGAFDETCWEGEIPGNLCHPEEKKGCLSGTVDDVEGQNVQIKDSTMLGMMCNVPNNQESSNESCGGVGVQNNPQQVDTIAKTCDHDIPTCETSTEEEEQKDVSSFDESVNDSYLLLAEMDSEQMHVAGNYSEVGVVACIGDGHQEPCKQDGSSTDKSSSDEDMQHHRTRSKTSCDDLPYSEGLNTFIDQLNLPRQDNLESTSHTGHDMDMEDTNVEDGSSKYYEETIAHKNMDDVDFVTSKDNELNAKPNTNTNVIDVAEEKETEAKWQEDFPFSEDLDAFLAEMDENITATSERKEETNVSNWSRQIPIRDETDVRVASSVDTSVDMQPTETKTDSIGTIIGNSGDLFNLKNKKGSTKSLFEKLVRRKTLMILNPAETSQAAGTSEASESPEKHFMGMETENGDPRKDAEDNESKSETTSQGRDKIVSDTDSASSVTSVTGQTSVGKSWSDVSIPDCEKGENTSTQFLVGKNVVHKSVTQSESSVDDSVFVTASEENHDFSALFDSPFGHLSDTDSPQPCRNCGDVSTNELPTAPTLPSRATSLLPSTKNMLSFRKDNIEMPAGSNNGNHKAATRAQTTNNCSGPTQIEQDCSKSANSDRDSPDSSPNELADTPYDSRCRSFLSVRGTSFNTTANGKCSDSAYGSSNTHLLQGAEVKDTSALEADGEQEAQRRKSVHFASHLESVHEICQLTDITGTDQVFDDDIDTVSIIKSPQTASTCFSTSSKTLSCRKSPLRPLENYHSSVTYEGTPDLFSQRLQGEGITVNSAARIKSPVSQEGTPNFFSQMSPTSAKRLVSVRKCFKYNVKSAGNDSTPNFFSQFSPQDSDSDGVIPGTEDKLNRRRVTHALKDVRYNIGCTYQGTPDLFESSLHDGSGGGDLGASPDLFGDSPIPDSPVHVRHAGVLSLCKRLFHRQ